MGKEPKPFDLLFWNADQTRMPKVLHLFYLREFYRDNKLAKGELELGGERLDLSKVKIPLYVQSSKEDHIAPYRSVYKGARLFGGKTRFMMAGSGHIAGVINAPVAHKYQHWTNDALPATVDEWIEGASEHPGSWWPNWAAWLAERSGPMIPARDPSTRPTEAYRRCAGELREGAVLKAWPISTRSCSRARRCWSRRGRTGSCFCPHWLVLGLAAVFGPRRSLCRADRRPGRWSAILDRRSSIAPFRAVRSWLARMVVRATTEFCITDHRVIVKRGFFSLHTV